MTTGLAQQHGTLRHVRALVGAAHIGPALAVTLLAGLLSAAQGLDLGTGTLVVAAVFAGQLSIGWSNDLIDLARDRSTGRTDKPLAPARDPCRRGARGLRRRGRGLRRPLARAAA